MLTLDSVVAEQATGLYRFTLTDPDGVGLIASQIEALTLTYYDVASGIILNSRDEQDVHNTNDVTIVTEAGPPLMTIVEWLLQPQDSVILDDQWGTEPHAALFRWTWDGGTRHGAHTVQFGIENMHRPAPTPV